MSIFEYDEEKVLRLLRESEFQDGVKQGEQKAKEILLPKMEELASENSKLTTENERLKKILSQHGISES